MGREQVGIKDNFFELGGHSLKATRLASQIHKQFNVRMTLNDLFTKVNVEEQAQWIAQAVKANFLEIRSAAKQAHYPLSASQRRIWVLSQFEQASIAYNMPGVYVFEGELEKEALIKSFAGLMDRHEILRTVFQEDEQGEMRQYIRQPGERSWASRQRDIGYGEGEGTLQRAIEQEVTKPFDLAAGPLLRATLWRVGESKWIFVFVMHHIIGDGWAMDILIRGLMALYNAHKRGDSSPLTPSRIQYRDYACWQQEQSRGDAYQRDKAWWLQQFEGEIPVRDLPADRMRPPVKTYRGGVVNRQIGGGMSQGIKELSHQRGCTLFIGLLAVVNALLYRYSEQEDIIIGSPLAGRHHTDLEEQVGLYVNTLALRTLLKGGDSYLEV